MNNFIKSPLNYVGGKYKILSQIIPLFPTDITSIELTLVDENNKETIYQYYVSYEEKEPDKLGSPNIYQSSYISNLGNLYILIDKNKKIDEVIDYNVINDEKNMDFHFTMLDIGEKS